MTEHDRRVPEPRILENQDQEPRWPIFDEAGRSVFDEDHRALLRILLNTDQGLFPREIRTRILEYRREKMAKSSLSERLQRLAIVGLVEKSETGQFAITEIGSKFLGIYDLAKREVQESILEKRREKAKTLPEEPQ